MKNHHHESPIHPVAKDLAHEAIAIRAYELWAGSGKPADQDHDIWLEAERELLAEQI